MTGCKWYSTHACCSHGVFLATFIGGNTAVVSWLCAIIPTNITHKLTPIRGVNESRCRTANPIGCGGHLGVLVGIWYACVYCNTMWHCVLYGTYITSGCIPSAITPLLGCLGVAIIYIKACIDWLIGKKTTIDPTSPARCHNHKAVTLCSPWSHGALIQGEWESSCAKIKYVLIRICTNAVLYCVVNLAYF